MADGGGCLPLVFISCVHTCISSCISSGATSLRVHDSSHRGFGCAAWPLASLLPFLPVFEDRDPSLDLNMLLKKGMAGYRSQATSVAGCIRFAVADRGGEVAVDLCYAREVEG
jgi:hypothetical protein